MLSHKQIWSAIDGLAARYGHSPSGLARAAGLDPTTFNKSKRLGPKGRLRWPSTESLSKILQVTGATMDDFVAMMTKSGQRPSRMLPFLKMKDAAKKNAFEDDGKPVGKAWDQFAFPDMHDPLAFALEITGDASAPLFRNGDVVVVSPAAEKRRGDAVVVKSDDGLALMRFVRETAKKVELKALSGSGADKTYAKSDVAWIARIVWARH